MAFETPGKVPVMPDNLPSNTTTNMAVETPDYYAEFPVIPDNWQFNTSFNNLGWITGLHNIAEQTINQIFGNYSEVYMNRDDPLLFVNFGTNIITRSPGPMIYLAICAAVLLLFLIVGVCWCLKNKCCCCCRSSFKAANEKDVYELENKYTKCEPTPDYSEIVDEKSRDISFKTIGLSLIMAVWLIGFLIMILFMFASNDKTKSAIDQIPPSIDKAFEDIDSYVLGTIGQLNYTAYESFEKLSDKAYAVLEECSVPGCSTFTDKIKDQLKEALNKTKEEIQTNYLNLESSFEQAQKDLEVVKELRVNYGDIITKVNIGVHQYFLGFNIFYCIVLGLILFGTGMAAFGGSGGMKTGGFFLLRTALVTMFIVGILVVLQLAMTFLIAGTSSEIICPAIRDMEVLAENPPENFIRSNPALKDVIRLVIGACKDDQSAYKVLNLEPEYNIDNFTETVDKYFKFEGSEALDPKIREQTVEKIQSEVKAYVDFVRVSVKDDMGRCKPLYNIYNSTVSLFCEKITSPIVSFWWILQFVPVVFALIFITAHFIERSVS